MEQYLRDGTTGKTALWAVFAGKMRAKFLPSGQWVDRVESTQYFSTIHRNKRSSVRERSGTANDPSWECDE
jgi:hypothetical protein